ncbi:type IV pilin protein [Noviherbaspirillum sp. 1P10PC]|uniref:type IV pilin protein n=1 Tax=Noviherbaspirillum sp. 1P10PC TaxID=3132292 RepID=UPI0039A3BEFB
MDRVIPAGFTLIELLVTVAIVGILGSLAWPSYVDHVRRGRIAEATGQLATLRVAMEQYYQDYRNYGDASATACGIAMPAAGQFSYTCTTSSNAQAFTIVASGTSGTSVAGLSYQIDHVGLRSTTALPSGWGAAPRNCWIASRGGTC